jgi:hypothetical protein
MISKYILAILIVLIGTTGAQADCEIVPSKDVLSTVKRLAYKDFPKAADILTIIRIESSFNSQAVNTNEREQSVGLMQVNGGPIDQRLNLAMGVSLLREYYMITGSKEGAIKSYNIGIGNYMKGKLPVSGATYYAKFMSHRNAYAKYTPATHHNGIFFGCTK